eukprot:jgi/Undpi1/2545/HiC_scaffold_13.g05924.m1
MVILKGFVSRQEQRELVAHVGRLGEKARGGFYSCTNEKTKRMKMMNLGLRTDGRKHVLEIPKAWTEIAVRVSERVGGGGEPRARGETNKEAREGEGVGEGKGKGEERRRGEGSGPCIIPFEFISGVKARWRQRPRLLGSAEYCVALSTPSPPPNLVLGRIFPSVGCMLLVAGSTPPLAQSGAATPAGIRDSELVTATSSAAGEGPGH